MFSRATKSSGHFGKYPGTGGIPTVLKNGVVGLGKELATPEGQAKAKQFLENTIQQSTDFTPEQKAQLVQYLNRSQEWPEKSQCAVE